MADWWVAIGLLLHIGSYVYLARKGEAAGAAVFLCLVTSPIAMMFGPFMLFECALVVLAERL